MSSPVCTTTACGTGQQVAHGHDRHRGRGARRGVARRRIGLHVDRKQRAGAGSDGTADRGAPASSRGARGASVGSAATGPRTGTRPAQQRFVRRVEHRSHDDGLDDRGHSRRDNGDCPRWHYGRHDRRARDDHGHHDGDHDRYRGHDDRYDDWHHDGNRGDHDWNRGDDDGDHDGYDDRHHNGYDYRDHDGHAVPGRRRARRPVPPPGAALVSQAARRRRARRLAQRPVAQAPRGRGRPAPMGRRPARSATPPRRPADQAGL